MWPQTMDINKCSLAIQQNITHRDKEANSDACYKDEPRRRHAKGNKTPRRSNAAYSHPVSTDRSPTHRDKEENRGCQGPREVGGEVLFTGDGFSSG